MRKGFTGFIPMGSDGGASMRSNVDLSKQWGHTRCGSLRVHINIMTSRNILGILLSNISLKLNFYWHASWDLDLHCAVRHMYIYYVNINIHNYYISSGIVCILKCCCSNTWFSCTFPRQWNIELMRQVMPRFLKPAMVQNHQ